MIQVAIPIDNNQSMPNDEKSFYLGLLFMLSNLFTIVLTVIPVLSNLPFFYLSWFGLEDIIRFLEPMIAIIFQLLIFAETNCLKTPRKHLLEIVFFSVSAGLYQQGAGYHSSSNMFKHCIETLVVYIGHRMIPVFWKRLLSESCSKFLKYQFIGYINVV